VAALDLAKRLATLGVQEILYTDIERDGMMQRSNIEGTRELAVRSGLDILASGGVSDLDDLRALKELEPVGVTGVIVGRALYEGRFSVAEARAVLD
jgi:phosphoribosylformimino-5-aminoimidazole carboxamide ribotide isomerase